MRAESSSARLLLKVLKEIYEVAKAIQSIADGFITIFYHYPSVKEQIISPRHTRRKNRALQAQNP